MSISVEDRLALSRQRHVELGLLVTQLRADKAALLSLLKSCGSIGDVDFFKEARAIIARMEAKS